MFIRDSIGLLVLLAAFGCGSSPSSASGPNEPEVVAEEIAVAQSELRSESKYVVRTEDERKALLTRELNDVMRIVTTEKDDHKLFQLRYWCAEHLDATLPPLIDLLTVEKFLTRIIHDPAATNGDLRSYGHGGVVNDDPICVPGRASGLLKELTKQDLGVMNMPTRPLAMRALQKKWQLFEERRTSSMDHLGPGR